MNLFLSRDYVVDFLIKLHKEILHNELRFENQSKMNRHNQSSSINDQSSQNSINYNQTGQHDAFVDLLDELRTDWDAPYALRTKTFPQYEGPYKLSRGERTPLELMEDTLMSPRVQAMIEQTCVERGWTREASMKEARAIALEMSHQFDMRTVRPLAYLAKKIIPKLFTNVYVNRARFEQLRQLSQNSAIVFVPSHRTYMDFILLQFLCFHYELKLPAIASAIDFLNMKFMGEALRRCGAFFIRRKFGDDQLYWAIFIEYVENQLKRADRPLEFFIEGTRSRTGKSLHPKYGLLSVLLEPYFRNEVFDFHLVPVSVSFSKYLEESLYAYELLGFPKPKESTSGLWRARSVLDIDFGDVYVHAGRPISVRDYFTRLERPLGDGGCGIKPIDRSIHGLKPSYLFEFTPSEQSEIRRLGHRIVKINESNAIVRTFPLMCLVLSKMIRRSTNRSTDQNDHQESYVDYEEFVQRTAELVDLTLRLGHRIPRRLGSIRDEIKYSIDLHTNMIEVISRNDRSMIGLRPVANKSDRSTGLIDPIDLPEKTSTIPLRLIDRAVPRLMLNNYGNQALHLFADVSMVALSILRNGDRSDSKAISSDFGFLQSLFGREFVAIPGGEDESCKVAIGRLERAGLVIKSDRSAIIDQSMGLSVANRSTAGISIGQPADGRSIDQSIGSSVINRSITGISTDQSINTSMANQSAKISISASTNPTGHRLINRARQRLAEQAASKSIDQGQQAPINKITNRSTKKIDDRSLGSSDQSRNQSTGASSIDQKNQAKTNPTGHRLINRARNRLAEQAAAKSIDQGDQRSTDEIGGRKSTDQDDRSAKSSDQSIGSKQSDQSTEESADQSTDISINQPNEKSIKQSIDQPDQPKINPTGHRLINRARQRLVDQAAVAKSMVQSAVQSDQSPAIEITKISTVEIDNRQSTDQKDPSDRSIIGIRSIDQFADDSTVGQESIDQANKYRSIDGKSPTWTIAINRSNSNEDTYAKLIDIASILDVYYRAYSSTLEAFLSIDSDQSLDEKQWVSFVQKHLVDRLSIATDQRVELEHLSGDTIKNCLHSLGAMGGFEKKHHQGGGETKFEASKSELRAVKSRLDGFFSILDQQGSLKAKL